MELERKTINYNNLKNQGTGSIGDFENYKLITLSFGKYEIIIRLSPRNEFIGVEGLKIKRDFLSSSQRIATSGFHDVEEFYEKE